MQRNSGIAVVLGYERDYTRAQVEYRREVLGVMARAHRTLGEIPVRMDRSSGIHFRNRKVCFFLD